MGENRNGDKKPTQAEIRQEIEILENIALNINKSLKDSNEFFAIWLSFNQYRKSGNTIQESVKKIAMNADPLIMMQFTAIGLITISEKYERAIRHE